MKHTLYGLVFLFLLVGALAWPTDMENSKDNSPVENPNEIKVEKSKMETPTELNKTEEGIPVNIDEEKEIKATQIMETENSPKPMESKENQNKEIPPQATAENEKQTQAEPAKQSPDHTTEMDKHPDFWKEFEDKFSLLEDRLPDLTDEQFMEINHEDAIPLNFLKGFDISKDMVKEAKLKEKDTDNLEKTGKPLAQSETPVYITIPIVINSHSNLPISLSIGGQEFPLKMMPKQTTEDGIAGDLKKLMYEATPPRRPTNRHRSNLRSKIYARNKRHEVFEFKRDIA